MFPFGSTLEQMSKQNMAMFERTMRMFSPFGVSGSGESGAAQSQPAQTEETRAPSPAAAPEPSPARKQSRAEAQEKAEEDAFTPSANLSPAKKIVSVPTPETSRAAAQNPASGDDVQNKIAALQRQLSDLTKNKA
jgi:polyhydroxyalkanoate synthesis regulator protein